MLVFLLCALGVLKLCKNFNLAKEFLVKINNSLDSLFKGVILYSQILKAIFFFFAGIFYGD